MTENTLKRHYAAYREAFPRASARKAIDHARAVLSGQAKAIYRESPSLAWQDGKRDRAWIHRPESFGLRHVGDVDTECRHRIFQRKAGETGYYTDHACLGFSGLLYGVVYQLPARNGESRFVPGYCEADNGGVLLDFSSIYVEPPGGYACAGDLDAARDAARCANDMAAYAAETAREYDAAFVAGTIYEHIRAEIVAMKCELADLYRARNSEGPRYHSVVREKIRNIVESIRECLDEMMAIKEGDAVESRGAPYWDSRSADLIAAFRDGGGGGGI